MAQQTIHKFVLGNKEVEGKAAEFEYDRGWYSISEVTGDQREIIYKSKNAQEAYMKWNVYIGRKKERAVPEERRRQEGNEHHNGSGHSRQESHGRREGGDRRDNHNNRRKRRDNHSEKEEHKY